MSQPPLTCAHILSSDIHKSMCLSMLQLLWEIRCHFFLKSPVPTCVTLQRWHFIPLASLFFTKIMQSTTSFTCMLHKFGQFTISAYDKFIHKRFCSTETHSTTKRRLNLQSHVEFANYCNLLFPLLTTIWLLSTHFWFPCLWETSMATRACFPN